MLDIKWIRDNPDALDEGLAKRGQSPYAAELIALDSKRRQVIHVLQNAQERRNIANREIAKAKRDGDTAREEALIAEMMLLKETIREGDSEKETLEQALKMSLMELPNIPAAEVDGGDESRNHMLYEQNCYRTALALVPPLEWKEHFEVDAIKRMMQFDTAAAMSGSRFVVLRGELARMERALGQMMLDIHVNDDFEEIAPPLIVRRDALRGTGQIPKFMHDLFGANEGNMLAEHYLIPTAEVPLVNLVREQTLKSDVLPLRFVALTPCFRLEAGAAGRDTRGMMRQHQFNKVEMVSITEPEKSNAEHELLVHQAEKVLRALDLKFRVMRLAAGDMGFSAQKTYDIEVWMPGQKAYREIASISNCGEFQARRMGAKFEDGDENRFVHTLNGSGVAVGRALIAVIENYQNANGTVSVPEALWSYMNGCKRIE